jgi:triacylglycerol lipase
MLDDRTGREGVTRIGHTGEYVFPYQVNSFGWDMLLGPQSGDLSVPAYAAPARAQDLSGLPPAMIGAGALDALMKENVDYAVRLMDAGVSAQLHVYAGAFHGFDAFDRGKSDVGNDFRRMRVETLRRAFA